MTSPYYQLLFWLKTNYPESYRAWINRLNNPQTMKQHDVITKIEELEDKLNKRKKGFPWPW